MPPLHRPEDRTSCRGCVRFDTQRTLLQAILDALESKRRMDAATRDRLVASVTSQLVLGPDDMFSHAFTPCAGPGCDTLFWLSTCAPSCHFRFVGGTVCGLADSFHALKVIP